MDEARRFLRYITPGLVFITETLILLWIIEPNVTQTILKNFKQGSSLGLVTATLLASGGVGFMLSVIHHYLHWFGKTGVIDHRQFVTSLRKRGIIQLMYRNSGEILDEKRTLNRFQAWSILTGLWHERLAGKKGIIKAADPRATSLTDLAHSLGTARVGAVAAWILTSWILFHNCTCTVLIEGCALARFIFGNMLAAIFLLLCCNGYQRTGKAYQRFVEQVLDDELTKEKENNKDAPTVTYVEV
jgi:hypothetical protein